MPHDDHGVPSIPLERQLTAVLALLIADREEHRSGTAPRTETILARAGLDDADIGCVTGRDTSDVEAILDRDRPVSVLDRARAHMTRTTA